MICDCFISSGDNSVIADPTFLIYEKATLKCGGNVKKIPLANFRHDFKKMVNAIDSKTRLFFITNPHNPAGTNVKKAEFEYVLNNVDKNILIVLDEAYCEYLLEDENINSPEKVFEYDNLIILRTFSKIYGLAGLRIGYGIAGKDIISGLNKVRLPFNVSSIAQKAAVVALENNWYVSEIRDRILKEKEKFYAALNNAGIEYIKSYSNFILIKTGAGSLKIVEELLKRGFIVRPGENLGVPGYIRVTVSTPEINDKFLDVFTNTYKSYYK
jgi:histidinol-phosphate aminotransferase